MNRPLTLLLRLLVAVLLLASVPLPAADKDTVRPAVGKPLQEANKDIQAKKFKEALVAIDSAEKVGGLTAYESFVINQMRGSAASGTGDLATAAASYEKVLAAKRLAPEDQLKMTEGVASLYLRAKNYPKTVQWIQNYRDLGGNKPETLALLPQVYYLSGDYKKAATEAAAQINAGEKAGRVPGEDALKLLASSLVKQNDMAGYTGALEKMVRYYPKPEYWTDLIQRTATKPGFSANLDLDMYRLLRATNNLTQAKDYMEMAQLSVQAGLPGEAKSIVEEGYAKKLLGTGEAGEIDRHNRLKALVEKKFTDDKAVIASTDQQAGAAPSGDPLVKTGLAYVTYGEAAKGLPMMEKGIAKGQLKAPEQSKLHLGYAYYLSGDKAKAQAALKTVGGTDGSADFARLWAIIAAKG